MKKPALIIAAIIGAIIAVILLLKRKATPPSNTISLSKGPNEVHYTGATMILPDALTNIRDFVEIVWYQLPNGEWLTFYFFYGSPIGELTELEYGKDYVITVTADCVWELPR